VYNYIGLEPDWR